METVINYTDDRAFVSSDERKTINRILKLKDSHPDEVAILALPESNDGCIYARCPAKWVQIRHPKKMEYTEEQRAEMAERMRKLKQQSESEGNDD